MKEATGLSGVRVQVSGEYAMICAAADRGWIDRDRVVMESLWEFGEQVRILSSPTSRRSRQGAPRAQLTARGLPVVVTGAPLDRGVQEEGSDVSQTSD